MAEADSQLSRRGLLGLLATAPFVVLVAFDGVAHAQDTPCVDLDKLTMAQKGMRRSIGFKLISPDAKKHCGACTFFTGGANGCGKCQLLSGGAVAAGSVCDSFALKG